MTNEELRMQARTSAPYIKIAGGLWALGAMTIMVAAVTWIVLAVMTGDYFSNPKVTRDAAEAGSGDLSRGCAIFRSRLGPANMICRQVRKSMAGFAESSCTLRREAADSGPG